MTNPGKLIECQDDQELLDFLLTYLTDSAYTSIVLNEYPDGEALSQDEIDFNISMALSQGFIPVMCYRLTEKHYYAFGHATGLTALIPVDIINH